MLNLRTSAQSYADQAEDHLGRSAEARTERAQALALQGIGYALLAIRDDLQDKGGDIADAVTDLGQDVCAELGDIATAAAPPLPRTSWRDRLYRAFHFPDKYDTNEGEVAP